MQGYCVFNPEAHEYGRPAPAQPARVVPLRTPGEDSEDPKIQQRRERARERYLAERENAIKRSAEYRQINRDRVNARRRAKSAAKRKKP